MDVKKRFLLGAIGGITPYLVTLLSIDFESAIGGLEPIDWFGLVVRCLVLIFLGSMVAYFHKSEKEPFKLFQLGLAAPALLATFINGGPGNNQVFPTPVAVSSYSFSIVSEAYAGQAYFNQGMLKDAKVSPGSRFLRGVIGTKVKTSDKDAFFVIAGSHKNKESAQRHAEELGKKNYNAVVYSPYGSSQCYSVVIASYVTKEEAVRVRERAISHGLPNDTYIWSYR